MKTSILLISFGIALLLSACNETSSKTATDKTTEISGRWKLAKAEQTSKSEKGVEYNNQPTNVVLHLQQNGYFIIYDTFVDPSWKEKGLPLIEQRSKGQWKYDGKTLTLMHTSGDTSYTETLKIKELSASSLITQGSDNKSAIYKTYGR